MALTLDTQSQAMLQAFQARAGTITQQVEQQIEAAQTAQQKLTPEVLERILLAAMPNQQQTIEQCKKIALCYHPDATNAGFLSQILDLQIEKTVNTVQRPAPQPVQTDPLKVQVSMAPDARFLLVFNARDVDENGRPLLMKVIAREGFDATKLDLSLYRTQKDNQPDVTTVPASADVVEVEDEHESEFQFGDPVKVVALSAKAEELSAQVKVKPRNTEVTKVWRPSTNNINAPDMTNLLGTTKRQGDDLDQMGVHTFTNRITLEPKLTVDPWDNPTLQPGQFTAGLTLERGFIFEPGATASVSLMGQAVHTGVAADDAQLLGSPFAKREIKLQLAQTFTELLDTSFVIKANGAGDKLRPVMRKVRDVVYEDARKTTLAGQPIVGYDARALKIADLATAGITAGKTPLANDPDGQRLSLKLPEGLLKDNGASVEGFKVVVGYRGASGKFVELKSQVVKSGKGSEAMDLSFDFDDSVEMNRHGSIEIRTYTPAGLPADRLAILYKEFPWASAATPDQQS